MQPKFAFAAALALGFAVADDSKLPWQVRHMKTEHKIDEFDAHAFFILHDSDKSNTWTKDDILNLYGLQHVHKVGDGSGMGNEKASNQVDDSTREFVYRSVLKLVDTDNDGVISIDEWRKFTDKGQVLPDFGLGPGHHGDYEYEYEVHHWKEFHQTQDPDVNIKHPEDIEHDRLYHQNEHGDSGDHDHVAGVYAKVNRIPAKYLRTQ